MTTSESNVKSKKLFPVLSLIFLVIITGWLFLGSNEPSDYEEDSLALLPVSVVQITPGKQTLTVKTQGITEPYWPTAVTAAVSGRMENLPEGLEPGVLLEQGQLLAQLLPVTYQAELDAAASREATARLELAREKHEQTVARKTSGQLKTPYARRDLQVAAAELSLKAAGSALENARQQLADTRISAPFSAVILEKKATPGQWVQAGEVLFQLASSQSVDIRVELSTKLWSRLGDLKPGRQAQVFTDSGVSWQAAVRYLSPVRDQRTRQRSLVLSVSQPYSGEKQLLPDQQVTVSFQGQEMESVLDIPASALTEDGYIWMLNGSNELERKQVQQLYEDESRAWVRLPENADSDESVKLIIYPLSSMLEGQRVQPEWMEGSEVQQ
ncbi:efflux RND transporter periplasmic adaptor subunit [Endozoicomonas arenosclerae]|uniref:efflux RND transporter periplasmic adaptor subunit n=1 Tax=Endozoicomonas arenosclerae TaxID=1633495 RepID=UPI000784853D|nr:efflux RND transporter periplasmic adaptor subunit [Endozoicomonas arenosclerae]